MTKLRRAPEPERWAKRAEELRAIAEQYETPECAKVLRSTARYYDRMAELFAGKDRENLERTKATSTEQARPAAARRSAGA